MIKHRLRKPSDKSIARAQTDMARKCVICGKTRVRHTPQEARACKAEEDSGEFRRVDR